MESISLFTLCSIMFSERSHLEPLKSEEKAYSQAELIKYTLVKFKYYKYFNFLIPNTLNTLNTLN
jgi:hypothetical protein